MKFLTTIVLLQIMWLASAQDVQLHYDLGKPEDGSKRDFFVSTVEMFRPDSIGSTFFFIDFEYNTKDEPRGASSGYWEISREFYVPYIQDIKPLKGLSLHIEYNDGLYLYNIDSARYGENINSAYLVGLGYPFHLGPVDFNAALMYKYIRGSQAPDAQFTLVWFTMLFNYKFTITGFADVWTQDLFDLKSFKEEKKVVFYAEPQFWYNATQKLAIGSEIKIGYNFFFGSKRTEVFPTIGVKYEF